MEHKPLTLTGIKGNRTMSRRNVEKCIVQSINGNGMMKHALVLFTMFAKLKVGLTCIILLAEIFVMSRKVKS